MTTTTAGTWRPTRTGFSRGQCLRRSLGDRLIRNEYNKKPRDAAAETPHMRIFMRRPGRARDLRFPDSQFFTHEPHGVRYTLLRVEGRRFLWALSGQVLREQCPRWLPDGPWKSTYPRYDDFHKVTEPVFRALQTIVSLLHGGSQPTPDRFDSPYVDALVKWRDQLDLGPVVNPWMQSLLGHFCRGGGRYIGDLPGWPLLMPVCARFNYQKPFDLVCRRFIRQCEVGPRNSPHFRGITLCVFKPAGRYLEDFLRQRQDLVDEVLAFLQEKVADFASSPRGHSKQDCAKVIATLLGECQAKTSDGRFTTTSLQQMVDLLLNAGDTGSEHAPQIQQTLKQVATMTNKIIGYRVSRMLFSMK